MGVVVSNGYRGANINKLIAPIPETKFETFDQIVKHNFTIYAEFSNKHLKFISTLTHQLIRPSLRNEFFHNDRSIMSAKSKCIA